MSNIKNTELDDIVRKSRQKLRCENCQITSCYNLDQDGLKNRRFKCNKCGKTLSTTTMNQVLIRQGFLDPDATIQSNEVGFHDLDDRYVVIKENKTRKISTNGRVMKKSERIMPSTMSILKSKGPCLEPAISHDTINSQHPRSHTSSYSSNEHDVESRLDTCLVDM